MATITEIALSALLKSVVARLEAVSSNFGTRVYLDVAPAEAVFPYAVISVVGGGADQFRQYSATFTLQAMVWGESRTDALTGLTAVANALDYQGEQESGAVTGGVEWAITTVTDIGDINLTEYEQDNTVPRFGNGKEYRFVMERK